MATLDGGEVDHLAGERATAQFDVDDMKVACAGSRHAVKVNNRMARLVASDPVFRKDTRTMLSRKELFKDTLKKTAHAWKHIVELRLTDILAGGPETQVLNYKTQQSRLFSLLASAYAYRFVGEWLKWLYTDVTQKLEAKDYSTLPEAHACTAGLKSVTTSATAEAIEEC